MDQSTAPNVNEKARTARVAGHFGELLQGRLGPSGPVVLVTLPCPVLETQVTWVPGGVLRVAGVETELVEALSWRVLAAWEAPAEGRLEIMRPAAPGAGAGSSTAELLGVLQVLAALAERQLSADEAAEWCHAVEGAVDPLMYHGNVLFASREPSVVEVLPPLPPMQVVGGFAGPGRRTDPQDQDFPDVGEALTILRAGLSGGDLAQVAKAARISAEANQRRNPNQAWDAVLALGRRMGALGPVVSHTGSAIGLILPVDVDTVSLQEQLRTIRLSGVIAFAVGQD